MHYIGILYVLLVCRKYCSITVYFLHVFKGRDLTLTSTLMLIALGKCLYKVADNRGMSVRLYFLAQRWMSW